jgi:hypothetical protein
MHSGQGLTWHRIMQLAPLPGKRFCTTFMKVAEIQFIAVFATCTHIDQIELEFA